MRTTSSTSEGDSFDSSLYWWSWLILPAVAGAASFARPRPLLWTAALIVPIIVAVALLGTVFHDPDDGASFWVLGELFVLVQGAITFGAASVGATHAGRS